MIHCHISFPNPLTHLLHIELKFSIDKANQTDLILPAWRPGRYELAPFSENIQRFEATSNNKPLVWEKTRPNIWTVDTKNVEELVVRYQYYAHKMDAGNSVLNDRLVYINFINCIMYVDHLQSVTIDLKIDIPESYPSVCSLTKTGINTYKAEGYQQLVDSPIVAAPDLKLMPYQVKDYQFNIAMVGDCPIESGVLISGFEKFTLSQIDIMGGFPTHRYDFIIHSLDYTHYHGVEHQNSTVLVLGPNNEADRDSYFSKLMGVASHELFHTWNVTRIRPAEMSPYDFSKETITKTGFVTEGFTTYYGDWFLKQSGVFNQDEYFSELNLLFKRHFENYGRHEVSLVQASQNLWVDGYKNLYPSKKVSIYVKGALCALILDMNIMKHTKNQYSLIDVIKKLYTRHTYEKGGYAIQDVYKIISEFGDSSMPELLEVLYESTADLLPILEQALSYVGCELVPQTHTDLYTSRLGIKLDNNRITEIAPGCHAENYLSVGDQILTCNDKEFDFSNPNLTSSNTIEIKRGVRKSELKIPLVDQSYFDSVKIIAKPSQTGAEQENLNRWLGNNLK